MLTKEEMQKAIADGQAKRIADAEAEVLQYMREGRWTFAKINLQPGEYKTKWYSSKVTYVGFGKTLYDHFVAKGLHVTFTPGGEWAGSEGLIVTWDNKEV